MNTKKIIGWIGADKILQEDPIELILIGDNVELVAKRQFKFNWLLEYNHLERLKTLKDYDPSKLVDRPDRYYDYEGTVNITEYHLVSGKVVCTTEFVK